VTGAPRNPIPRRRLLLAFATSISPVGCANGAPSGRAPRESPGCATPSDGGGVGGYCLVDPRVFRITNGRALGVGQALLANFDDNTAVIVARDADGFHALSAICTHACCLVSLCRVSTCTDVTSNPGECRTTQPVSVDENASAIVCPCHGSSFRLLDGTPTGGPARRPLPSYTLRFDGEDALVDTAQTVDPATRVS